MESDTSKQQQLQQRPESIFASDAEKRAITANRRPGTRESTNQQPQNNLPTSKRTNEFVGSRPTSRDVANMSKISTTKTPHATPRDSSEVIDIDSVDQMLKSMVSGNAAPGEEKDVFDEVLDEDELFMALSPEERDEWDKMMTDREQRLEESREKHQNWSDSFTRRRMFANTRMRKLNLSYQDRIKLFSSMSDTMNRVISSRSSVQAVSTRKPVTKRLSEPLLQSSNDKTATKFHDKTLKRSETIVDASSKLEHLHSSSKTSAESNDKKEKNSRPLGLDTKDRKASMDVVCKVEQVT